MGEAVIRGNLIRSCFISSGSPTPSSTIGVRGKPSAQRGPSAGWGCSLLLPAHSSFCFLLALLHPGNPELLQVLQAVRTGSGIEGMMLQG